MLYMSRIMKYRKKPIVVEAWQYTYDKMNNFPSSEFKYLPEFIAEGIMSSRISDLYRRRPFLVSLDGHHATAVSEGDYIIKGVEGEFYPCKPSVFEKSYEACDE